MMKCMPHSYQCVALGISFGLFSGLVVAGAIDQREPSSSSARKLVVEEAKDGAGDTTGRKGDDGAGDEARKKERSTQKKYDRFEYFLLYLQILRAPK